MSTIKRRIEMSKVLAYLKELFKDADGDPSTKRIIGAAGFVVAVVLAFTERDVALVGAFLTFTAGAMGITAYAEK
jgi:hypothetical protein